MSKPTNYTTLCTTVIIVPLLLQGCAFLFGINETNKNKIRYNTPQIVESNFNLSGRFAVNNNNHHQYGNFTWTKSNNYEELDFNSPLGQTIGKITIESSIATLTTDNKVYRADDLDSLEYQQLGFTLPMNYLHYWILGAPLPNIPLTQDTPNSFEQLGWLIEYLKINPSNNRPQIIRLTKDSLIIKLLVKYD